MVDCDVLPKLVASLAVRDSDEYLDKAAVTLAGKLSESK